MKPASALAVVLAALLGVCIGTAIGSAYGAPRAFTRDETCALAMSQRPMGMSQAGEDAWDAALARYCGP